MRRRIEFASLVLGCAAFVSAGAQTVPQPQDSLHDWGGVVLLAPGTPISVLVGRHWHRCSFDWADQNSLKCWMDRPARYLTPDTMAASAPVFRREGVTKVRLEKKRDGTLIGAAIGGGLGVLPGAIGGGNGHYTQGGREIVGGAFGALFGGVVGHYIPIRSGKVIYVRPASTANGPSASSTR